MTRTFCDICKEALEDRSNPNSLDSERPAGKDYTQTSMEGECYVNSHLLRYRFTVSPLPGMDDICRKCVLKAVRYIADNK